MNLNYRLQKFLTGAGFAVLLYFLFSICIDLSTGSATYFSSPEMGLAVLCLGALFLTLFRLPEYLGRLEDRMNLRLLVVPMFMSSALSLIALLLARDVQVLLCASLSLLGWLLVFLSMRRAFAGYVPFFRGSLPVGIWLNPPVDVLEPGDIILVHGPMADRVRNAVGHSELVLAPRSGKQLHVLSSIIETGLSWHTARSLLYTYKKGGYDYIVMRLKVPMSQEQIAQAQDVVDEMRTGNSQWLLKAQGSWRSLCSALPLPLAMRDWLTARFMPTGYDQCGKYWGGMRAHRWTCIGTNLYLLSKIGIPVAKYGTGALGICGEFNPLMPVRLMRDPAYRWLSEADAAKSYHLASSAKKNPDCRS